MRPIAPLKRRFAALLYESLLIGSVTILAGIAAGIINTAITRSAPTLAPAIPLLTSLVFVLAWWQYFRLNWQREANAADARVANRFNRPGRQPPRQKAAFAALCMGVRAAGVPPLAGVCRFAAVGLARQKRRRRRAVLVDIAVGLCPV